MTFTPGKVLTAADLNAALANYVPIASLAATASGQGGSLVGLSTGDTVEQFLAKLMGTNGAGIIGAAGGGSVQAFFNMLMSSTGATAIGYGSGTVKAALDATSISISDLGSRASFLKTYPSALPYEVLQITGGGGSGGTPGTYVGGTTGGFDGFTWSVFVGSDGKAVPRIDTPGISTSNTAPTLVMPTIPGLTGATTPVAVVGTIPVNRLFMSPSTDGSQRIGWINSAGSLSPYLMAGVQYSEYLKAGVDAAIASVTSIISEIQTDAFAMARVDKDGFLIELLGNDFLQQSPNQTFLLDLISHSTIETDAFAYALVDSAGFLIDAFIADSTGSYWASTGKPILTLGAIPDVSAAAPVDGDTLSFDAATGKWKAKAPSTADVTPYMPAGNYLAAAIYGQSVFRGFDTTAISTSAFSGGGLLMFNGGMSGLDYSNSANLASLTNAVEAGVESAGRGVGESFSQFFASEAGYAFTADGVNLILSVPAEGGKSAAELSSGGAYFPRLQYMIDAIDTLARAGGKVPDVVHIVYCQGEADTVGGTSAALWYSQIETGIRQPFETYCQTKFGRKTKVRVIMTQVASHEFYGITDPAIARQVLAMCNTDPNYILAGPMYQYNYGAAGIGSHLLNATEVKWAAAMCGRALQRAARGVRHKWINPLRAWQDGPRTVAIEYDVPVGPLVIDTVSVTDPGQKGFNLYSGSTEVPISAVSIVGLGKRTVLLTTSSDIPAGSIRVDYAHKGGATNVNAGRTTGSRGCLRDSDPAVFDPSGINKPLFNWAPIHRVTVG